MSRSVTSPTRPVSPRPARLTTQAPDVYQIIADMLEPEDVARLMQAGHSFDLLKRFTLRLTHRTLTMKQVKEYFGEGEWNVTELKMEVGKGKISLPPALYPTLRKLILVCNDQFRLELDLSNIGPLPNLNDLTLESSAGALYINSTWITQHPRITKLALKSCNSDFTFLERMPRLRTFTAIDTNIKTTAHLRNCTRLTTLNLHQSIVLSTVEGLEECTELTKLDLGKCTALSKINWGNWPLQELSLPGFGEGLDLSKRGHFLTTLTLDNCRRLPVLPAGLQNLTLVDCKNEMTNLGGLANASNLVELRIEKCHGITTLAGLEKSTQLRKLVLRGMRSLSSLEGLHDHLMEEITIADANDLKSLAYCPETRKLTLDNTGFSLANISRLSNGKTDWQEIEEFVTVNMMPSANLAALAGCHRLRKMLICNNFDDVPPLGNFPLLTELEVSARYLSTYREMTLPKVVTLSTWLNTKPGFISAMFPNVTTLTIQLTEKNLSFLNEMPHLTSLTLKKLKVTSLDILREVIHIPKLIIMQCHKLQSLDGLNPDAEWARIEISNCSKLENVDALTNLAQLTYASINNPGWRQTDFVNEHAGWKVAGGGGVVYIPKVLTEKEKGARARDREILVQSEAKLREELKAIAEERNLLNRREENVTQQLEIIRHEQKRLGVLPEKSPTRKVTKKLASSSSSSEEEENRPVKKPPTRKKMSSEEEKRSVSVKMPPTQKASSSKEKDRVRERRRFSSSSSD